MSEAEQYIVEKVKGKKIVKGKIMYYVKWKGFPENENTWEPINNFQDPKPYKDYENMLNKKNKKKNKKITKSLKNETSTESLVDFDIDIDNDNDNENLGDENKIKPYFLRKKKKSPYSIRSENEKNKIKKVKKDNVNEEEEEFEEKSEIKEEKIEKEIKNKKIENEKEKEKEKESEEKIKKKEGKLGINPLNKIKHCYINKDDNKNYYCCVEFKNNDNEEFSDAIFTFEEIIKVDPELLARYLIDKVTFKLKK